MRIWALSCPLFLLANFGVEVGEGLQKLLSISFLETPLGCGTDSGWSVQVHAWPVPVVTGFPTSTTPPQRKWGEDHKENPGGGKQRKGVASPG